MQGLGFRRHDSRRPQPLRCDAVLWSPKAACRRHCSHGAEVGPGMLVRRTLLAVCMMPNVRADASDIMALPQHSRTHPSTDCCRVLRTSCHASTWRSQRQSLPRRPSRSTSPSSGSLALPSPLQGRPLAMPAPQRHRQPLAVHHHALLPTAGLPSRHRGTAAVVQQQCRLRVSKA
jgi:hypothetical protein